MSILLSLFVLSLGGLETRDSHGELLAKKAPCSPFAPLVLSFYSPSFFWRRRRRSSQPPYPPSSNAQRREGGRGVRRVGIANHDSTIQKMVQGKRRGRRRRNERRGGRRGDKNFLGGTCMHKCFWPRSLHRLLSDELAGSVALLLFAIYKYEPSSYFDMNRAVQKNCKKVSLPYTRAGKEMMVPFSPWCTDRWPLPQSIHFARSASPGFPYTSSVPPRKKKNAM